MRLLLVEDDTMIGETVLDVLRAEGCNEAQGFFLGRPGPMNWAAQKPEQATA